MIRLERRTSWAAFQTSSETIAGTARTISFRPRFCPRLPKVCSPMYVRLTIMFRTCAGLQITALCRLRFPDSEPLDRQSEVQGMFRRVRSSAIFWQDFFSSAHSR